MDREAAAGWSARGRTCGIRLAPIGACVAHPLDGCEANKVPLANLLEWAKITDQLYIWHYSTNFAHFLQPLPDLDEIAGTIPLFKKQGVVGIFYEGDMVAGGGGEMSELKAYLMAKLMWEPTRDPKPIIDEFVTGVYGPAAPQIKTWLDLLHTPARQSHIHAKIYDPPTSPYLTDELLVAGTRLFDEAEAAAKADPVALEQVQRARLALEYVQLCRSTRRQACSRRTEARRAREHRRRQDRPVRDQLRARGRARGPVPETNRQDPVSLAR